MYESYAAAGGGWKGRGMALSTFAYGLTQPIFGCVEGLATGAGVRATSSQCGQAALTVVPAGGEVVDPADSHERPDSVG